MATDKEKLIHADCIIIGAGIFGLYAAKILSAKKMKVIILESGLKPFARASSINQARVHNGYHYPRSYETAKKVADYYERFNRDFSFAVNHSFKHVYAISSTGSKISGSEFADFCKSVNIPTVRTDNNKYFICKKVEVAFEVQEPAFDFAKIRDYLMSGLNTGIRFIYDCRITNVSADNSLYHVRLADGIRCSAPLVINATYAGINDIIGLFGQKPFKLKYELCEVAFCKASKNLRNLGFTIMDGDYFSVMPYGHGEKHTLTTVGHTPHEVSYCNSPVFSKKPQYSGPCKMHASRNCIVCSQSLTTAWRDMRKLYNTFVKPEFAMEYEHSMFEIKPILMESEKDDSRPTIIKRHTSSPSLISVFSGKISTIYDLERYL